MTEEKVEILRTNINSSVLYELGGMYTMVSQTLREFVQNSFDSYANNVDINIDIVNDVITITDDGIGMNDYIVRNHYKDVGFSSKNLDDDINDKMPTVPSELIYNLNRPKIGSKGMGKLSWILLANVMETITTTIDMDKAIKIEFSVDDLENNKLSYVNKDSSLLFKNGHGTVLRLRGLKIKDFGRYSTTSDKNSFNEIEELTNTIGFLGVTFPNFRVYLSINSHTDKFARQLIIKKLYFKGIQIKKSGIFNFVTSAAGVESKKVPYDFMLIIPDHESKNSLKSESEFWLLSQYMGVKKLEWITGISGYLNIDNIKLVANRNDIQSNENDLYRKLKDTVCNVLVEQLVTIYNSDESEKISILDLNQNDLLRLVYNSSMTYRQLKIIIPYLKFKFYIEGEHRLKDFESDEKTIYYYFDNNDVIADKASYCGYKCFEVVNESIIKNTLDNAYPIKDYIQNIEKLPKEAYETTGSSVTPIGGLKDVLGNLGPIFDSLAFAIIKIENNISKMKNELKTKKFSVVQRKERLKEIAKLEKSLLSLKYANTGGVSSASNVSTAIASNILDERDESVDRNIATDNNVKKGAGTAKDALILSSEHYFKYNILDREYLIGFASLEDEDTIANIVMKRYITFNLKNDYIKDSLAEKNPIRQVIMLLPLICHEICHEWSSTHDETFQMMFDALLIPSLDCLTRQIFEGDLKVKKVEEISINDKGEKKEKGFYFDKHRCSICRILLANPESVKTGICGDCSKKVKGK